MGGHVQRVQALLAHGADVNAQATIELVNMDSITYPVSNFVAGLASFCECPLSFMRSNASY